MIVFLTLVYCGVLALLVKLKVIKLNTFWKLSPVIWMVLLLIVLFIPMQFFAPYGPLRTYHNVVRIVPQVSGRVVDVPVKPNVPVKKGDVLFRIDPRQYQYSVDRFEAALKRADVGVSQLEQQVQATAAATQQARENLLATETDQDRRARENLEAAEARVTGLVASLEIAKADLARMEQALKSEAVSRRQYDAARQQVDSLDAQLTGAQADVRNARLALESGGDRIRQAAEAVAQAEAVERQARLEYEAEIDGLNPTVREIAAQLDEARRQLSETVVYAPADGTVTALALRPGSPTSRVAAASVISYVENSEQMFAAMIRQTQFRHIKVGLPAEVVLELYPGQVFNAKVHSIPPGQGQGQLAPSGNLPIPDPTQPNAPLYVRLEPLDWPSDLSLPIGAGGSATIYTDQGAPTHVIRKVMVRMETYLNYIF